jgi:hypothetical protein
MRHRFDWKLPVATLAALAAVATAGCGGGAGESNLPMAQASQATVGTDQAAGASPFIAFLTVAGQHLDDVTSANVVIAPQAGTVSKPVSLTFSRNWLLGHGYAQPAAATMTVPVFGLYAGTANPVTLTLEFSDDTVLTLSANVTTAADTPDVYTSPAIAMARAPGSRLGFDFFYIKSARGGPVILDTDARVRWRSPGTFDSQGAGSSTFTGDGFVIGTGSATIVRAGLDGTFGVSGSIAATGAIDFHHDIEDGRTGLLADIDTAASFESVAMEIMPDGTLLHAWDLGQILSDYMRANGDDPTLFVRPEVDWFHMNTAVYDRADDSVIVSSRENFVIKLDYETGAIRWIFGDTTKYWYTFPSLRARSLALAPGGLAPIGQHAVNIAPDGNLLLFNDGLNSAHQPPGAPAGELRPWSEVSSYRIDDAAMTATEAWGFDYGKTVYSPICSSARELPDGSVLVDYAAAEGITAAYLVGLDANHTVVFDFRYPETGCSTAWNSQPIALEAMLFQ